MKMNISSGRPTVGEVDLEALEFNYRQIQKRISEGVKLLAVVKADAYGHGAIPVSLKLEKLGVEYLGVAIPEEGVELRKGGVKAPILVLGGIFGGEVDQIFRFRLTPVIFRKDSLKLLSREAERRRRKVKVHLKVDTGMGRLGVPLSLWPDFLKEVKRFTKIEIEGVLSHFSMTDEEKGYTQNQWRAFQRAVAIVKEMGISCQYLHMASSATLTAFSTYSGNLVRPGIMLYGSYPSPAFQALISLKPVMTLKTRIHFLKSVPSETRISYGGTFTTKRESLIATLPIGYADGYSRHLSNHGEVLIHGKRAPVAGKVCMDFIMVDVTDIPRVSVGDEVILMGRQGREQITAEEIAVKINSISYEVLCLIGKRVPRVYKG
ncbi:MAG: alanine racemase [Deltaproteobacteria bacterium CG03_land_8_20_14_0_80_45_14]|nr:MAG: alanine racemase [Deltaproteobacteria bacterium CG03_land_8_20_14_0_80_45_14]